MSIKTYFFPDFGGAGGGGVDPRVESAVELDFCVGTGDVTSLGKD
jgi:hypothetical protein